jgi:hypothetical protein
MDEPLPAAPPPPVAVTTAAVAAAAPRKKKSERSSSSSSGSGVGGSLERTGLTSLEPELYNQLRGLQKSARELRQVVALSCGTKELLFL